MKILNTHRRTFGGIYIVNDETAFRNASLESFKRLGLLEGRALSEHRYQKEGFRKNAQKQWQDLTSKLGLVYAGEEAVNQIKAAQQ